MSAVQIPFELVPGRKAYVNDRTHVLDRVDGDDSFVWRLLGSTSTFQIPDPVTGFPRYPDSADMLRLMADDTIQLQGEALASPTAEGRRNAEYHVSDARALDPVSDLRIAFCRSYDRAKCNLSDRALTGFYEGLLKEADFKLLALAHPKAERKGRQIIPWKPCGATLRHWLGTRGEQDDRRQVDGVSGTGRGKREKKLRHPPEHLFAWIARSSSNRRNVRANWESYKGELALVSQGLPTHRRDENGQHIRYPRPAAPYSPISYSSFYRLHLRMRSKAAREARDGRKAAASAYGGGGVSETPTHVGAICGLDDTPVPVLCKIEIGTDVYVGRPTLTKLEERRSNAIMGWDLSWDAASSATVLRTVAHASMPKRVPAHIDRAAQLSSMVVKPDLLIIDNLSAHHGRHVEDSLREIGTDVRFTGSGKPRDKAETEDGIGKLLAFAFKGLPTAVDAIEIRRHDADDPPVEMLPTIAELRDRLDEAVALLNLRQQKPLMGRSALSVYLRELDRRRVKVIKDLPAFRRAIGMVEYEIELRASGIGLFTCLRYVQPQRSGDSLFDRLRHLERPTRRTKVSSVRVKVKFDSSDLGRIQIWDPVDLTYVTFVSDMPDYTDGLPLWLHKWILADIDEDERATCPPETLVAYRAALFARQSEITQAAGEEERRRAASVADTPMFRRVMGEYVEVGDEGFFAEPVTIDDDRYADLETTGRYMTDATTPTPRKPPRSETSRARANVGGTPPRPAPTPPPRRSERMIGRPPRPRSPSNLRSRTNNEGK